MSGLILKIVLYGLLNITVSGLKSGNMLPDKIAIAAYTTRAPFPPLPPAKFPDTRQNVDGIIRQTSQSNSDESYEYSYETANGIKVEETGIRSNLQDLPIISSGSFQYLLPDNTPIAVTYVANENGFQPEGSHLPTPPPIPPQIVRALEWNAAHPELNKQ